MNLNLTPLEIVLIAILWIIIASFINYKRDWYRNSDVFQNEEHIWPIAGNYVLLPFSLIVAFIRQFIISDWE